ncbi:MAG: hypothetical protein GC156_01300 [Actinomycetales bacterium]|nr:hypothetical protein [Actinomycetales bacterium]
MSTTSQVHHVTLIPQADKVEQTRALLVQCAERVAAARPDNGPLAWRASFDEEVGALIVDAIFPDEEAVAFHQANIKDIVATFAPMMAAPPITEIRMVFTAA